MSTDAQKNVSYYPIYMFHLKLQILPDYIIFRIRCRIFLSVRYEKILRSQNVAGLHIGIFLLPEFRGPEVKH